MDVEVYESNNGGDILKTAKDISVIYGWENFPYLALFGGNLKASTPTKRLESEQDFSFWGNNLFHPANGAAQFNSETERALANNTLTSAGRLQIESAIKKDLDFMKAFAVVKVKTRIVATDVILMFIDIKQPDNLQAKEFVYIWDATRQELFDRDKANIGGGITPPDIQGIFDYTFDFTFD